MNLSKTRIVKLGNICQITTGKLDANAMSDDGQYMFFTCSKDNYKTDTYAFEGEVLLIAGVRLVVLNIITDCLMPTKEHMFYSIFLKTSSFYNSTLNIIYPKEF